MPKLNWRRWIDSNLFLAIIATTSGVLAATLGTREVARRTAEFELKAQRSSLTSQVVVASRDIDRGQALDASVLSVRSIPRDFAPADAISPEQAGQLIGRRSAIALRRGTPVVSAALLTVGGRQHLAESFPPGMRALTIPVDTLGSLSGRLEPGDKVDLLYSHARGGDSFMAPLLQQVPVLATGALSREQASSLDPEEPLESFSSVTLLLAAADARKVALAEQAGRISVLLRHPTDEGRLDPRAISSSELLGTTAPRGLRGEPWHAVELLVGGNGISPARRWLVPPGGARGEGA